MADFNYSTISPAYDDLLSRAETIASDQTGGAPTVTNNISSSSASVSSDSSGSSSIASSGGSVETTSVKSSGAIGDIWITSFIKSTNYKPKKQGFLINGPTGYIEAAEVWLSGTITAVSGAIGGWDISPGELSSGKVKLQSNYQRFLFGDATSYSTGIGIFLGLDGSDYKFRAGDPDGDYLGWDGTNLNISGAINATSGTIGGFVIEADNIHSTNYASGVTGSGLYLSNNLVECGNIATRGMIRTAVFQKDVVSAVGGNLMVINSDILNTDMTALDTCNLEIGGTSSFSTNDFLRIKEGDDDEWFQVTGIVSTGVYSVTRDMAGDYDADDNPLWKKGATVVSYGPSGAGVVYMTASETNAPYVSIATHSGSPWTTMDTKVRLGNLTGTTDPSDGSSLTGYGLWTDNVYLSGVIVANTGKIGGASGWLITAGKMSSVASGNTTEIASGVGNVFIAGTTGAPQFIVTSTGDLTASSATISGKVDVSATGYVRGGQTAFNTGTGFFLGFDDAPIIDIINEAGSGGAGGTTIYGTNSGIGYRYYGQAFTSNLGVTNYSIFSIRLDAYRATSGGTDPISVDFNLYLSDTTTYPISPSGAPLFSTTIDVAVNSEDQYDVDISSVTLTERTSYVVVLSFTSAAGSYDSIGIPLFLGPCSYRGPEIQSQDGGTWVWGPGSSKFQITQIVSGYKVSIGDPTKGVFAYDGLKIAVKGGSSFINTTYSGTAIDINTNALSLNYFEGGTEIFYIKPKVATIGNKGGTMAMGWNIRSTKSEIYFNRDTSTSENTAGITFNLNWMSGTTPFYRNYSFGSDNNGFVISQSGTYSCSLGSQVTPFGNAYMTQIGDSSTPVTRIYVTTIGTPSMKASIYGNIVGCPLPMVEDSLAILDRITQLRTASLLEYPEEANYEFDNPDVHRLYLDTRDAPEEIKVPMEEERKMEIEHGATIGFLMSVVRELNTEIKSLKERVTLLEG